MYQSTSITFNPLISLDSSTLAGSYTAFGSGFTYPVRILHIVNNSDSDATISFDGGTTDHIFIPAGSFVLYDFGTNKGESAPALELKGGSPMMINGSAGTGLIYAMSAAAVTPTMTIPS